jgi:hypothetical protein
MVTNSFKDFSKVVLLLFIDALAFYSSLVIAFYTRALLNMIFPGLIAFDIPLRFLKAWWMPAIVMSLLPMRLYNKKSLFGTRPGTSESGIDRDGYTLLL